MDSWYYATAGRQRHGPVQAAHLRELAAAGTIDTTTLVWREGFEQWRALAEVATELGIALPPPNPYQAAALPPTPVLVIQSPVEFVPTQLVWAILSTLFCCWPLGVVSIVYACRVDGLRASGDVAGAWDASRKARLWAMWSALSIVILLVFCLVVIALDGGLK